MFNWFKKKTDVEKELEEYQNSKNEAPAQPAFVSQGDACFEVEDIFSIVGRGTVVTGKVLQGEFAVGDEVRICAPDGTEKMKTKITGLEMFRRTLNTIVQGDNAGVLLSNVTRTDIAKKDMLLK